MSEVWGHTASELINRELPKTSLPRMREYVGEHITWMLLDGHHDSEIVASMRKSVVDCCEVPSAISEADIKKQVRMIREKLEAAGRIQPIRPNEDRSGLSPYIVPRKDSNTAGMFPRGKVSLIAGSSGTGKTILFCHWLEDLRQGQPVLEHPAATADYRIIILDRTVDGLHQSLEHTGLDVDEVTVRAEQIGSFDGDPADILERFLYKWREELPDLVFLEGIDFAVGDMNNPKSVFQFIKKIEPVARLWGVAVVASIGSPKQKAKQEYSLARDQIIGSSAWGRVTDTLILIKEDGDARHIVIKSRTGRDEQAWFWFDEGRVVISPNCPGLESLNTKTLNVDAQRADKMQSYEEMKAEIEKFQTGRRISASGLWPHIPSKLRIQILQRLELEGLVAKITGHWTKTAAQVIEG